MSQPDTLAQLAAEMVPCPKIHDWPTKPGANSTPSCLQVGCSGTVPLVLGLRKLCWLNPDSGDHQYDEVEHDDDLGIHPAVGCPGYTLVSEAEALLVLLNYEGNAKFRKTLRGWECLVEGGGHLGEGLTAPDALASALAQARGLEEGT